MSSQPAHNKSARHGVSTTPSLRVDNTQEQDHENFRVEFPLIPLHVTSDKEVLDHANVVIHLLNNAVVRGQLVHFLASHKMMVVLRESDLKAIGIPTDKIRYVLFRQRLSIPNHQHPIKSLTDSAVIPLSVQPYDVLFKDNGKINGKTFTSSTDDAGLHFFQFVDEQHVVRVFVPMQAIKSYHVGTSLNVDLVKHKKVGPEHIHAAIKQQNEQRNRKIAEYPLLQTALNSDDLTKALHSQSSYITSRAHNSPRIGEVLLEEKLITQEQLDSALFEQQQGSNKKIGQILVEMGVISTESLHIALAHKLSIPFVKLHEFDFAPNVFDFLPADIAQKYVLVPLYVLEDRLVVAMEDPSNIESIDLLRFVTGRNIEPAIATKEDIVWAINYYYSIEEDIEDDLSAAEEAFGKNTDAQEESNDLHEIMRLGKEKPIVHLVNNIIVDAIRRKASDIHIRPREQTVDLILRIDGSLIKVRSFSRGLLSAVSSRIKILGSMDIAERRLPQDGRSHMIDRGENVDLRISIIPTVNGESIVIRLLNAQVGLKSVSELGFNLRDEENMRDLLHRNNGIFFVTGPTGSGKSTTLYAALKELINRDVNIITVEDPVEYHIDGIEQIQVHSQIGYTFARALRHILRHDPDVIMIGEVRDEETAKIAVESALTGHLVLSTLHTNDAASAIARMLEMGIESYMLGPTILGVLAQRLVKRNCPHCLDIEETSPHIRELLNVKEHEVFYKGTGCDNCNHTGHSGRLAVYELLVVTQNMREFIENRASTEVIYKQALSDGMKQLTTTALEHARQRRTSLGEVYRVRLD